MAKILNLPDKFYHSDEEHTVPNNDFICPLCHEHDYVPSEIILQANYGSVYDGERVTLQLCGECFDKIWNKAIVKGATHID